LRPARPWPWRRGVSFLDKAWNSIPDDPAPRPYISHFAGIPFAERVRRLETLSAR
jgi:hypothetical protein